MYCPQKSAPKVLTWGVKIVPRMGFLVSTALYKTVWLFSGGGVNILACTGRNFRQTRRLHVRIVYG